MSPPEETQPTVELRGLLEVLYHLRASRETKNKAIAKMHTEYLEGALAQVLWKAGIECGSTALEADAALLQVPPTRSTPVQRVVEKVVDRVVERRVDEIEALLEEAAQVSGSSLSIIPRELGRFNLFCARAWYAGATPDPFMTGRVVGSLMEDDATEPVAAWIRDHNVDKSSLIELARAYVAWTRKTCTDFLAEKGLR